MMHAEPALADTQKLEIPTELMRALNSGAHKPKTDYGIEALKPSLLGRLIEKLLGPKN
ncbi:MAG: hypothetical protein JWO52_1709 [Gammaproteobacteria bacterium]|jgi:hypothetical protein|nr:hypothetical protein [Gammaproteobacteria bacterium]MDB6160858.1 hypothetical protein [Gammaproteobacteria bacterium]